jgi:hypothetical protein
MAAKWRQEEKDLLIREYWSTPNSELEKKLGRSANTISKYARNLGLLKDPELVKETLREAAKIGTANFLRAMEKRRAEAPKSAVKIHSGYIERTGNVTRHWSA